MSEMCADNRFELIDKYKQKLISGTNIILNDNEMKEIDNILYRFWQMGWLDKLEQSDKQWIPCKEKLPPNTNKTYWVCLDNGYQCECRWTNDVYGFGEAEELRGWSFYDIPIYATVKAWCELPEPYKEQDGTN